MSQRLLSADHLPTAPVSSNLMQRGGQMPRKYQKIRLAPARFIGRLDFAFATAGSGGFLHFDRNPNY
jgi:hypothetical protein